MNDKLDLAKIITDNSGCVAVIDNDCWWLYPAPPKPQDELSDDEWDDWRNSRLARDGEVIALGDGGCGSGHCYGGDVLQALAKIVGVKVESV